MLEPPNEPSPYRSAELCDRLAVRDSVRSSPSDRVDTHRCQQRYYVPAPIYQRILYNQLRWSLLGSISVLVLLRYSSRSKPSLLLDYWNSRWLAGCANAAH